MKKIKMLGIFLIIFGLCLYSYNYYKEIKSIKTEKNKIENTIKNYTSYNTNDVYDMVLSIPKIALKKGIYKKDDKRNNIEENVTIHKESDYPDSLGSNVILMAHSGTSKISYFDELDKLDYDSLIEIYYNEIKYVYKIGKIYDVNKDKVYIEDDNRKRVTLITCSKKDKTKQVVYVGYIIDEI